MVDSVEKVAVIRAAIRVSEVLEAASHRVSSGLSSLLDDVRRALSRSPLDELIRTFGEWRGEKWLDLSEKLHSVDWYNGLYSETCAIHLSEGLALFGVSGAPKAGGFASEVTPSCTVNINERISFRVCADYVQAGRALSSADVDRLTEFLAGAPPAILDLCRGKSPIICLVDVPVRAADARPYIYLEELELQSTSYLSFVHQVLLYTSFSLLHRSDGGGYASELHRQGAIMVAGRCLSAFLQDGGEELESADSVRRYMASEAEIFSRSLTGCHSRISLTDRLVAELRGTPVGTDLFQKTDAETLAPPSWALLDAVSELECVDLRRLLTLFFASNAEAEIYLSACAAYVLEDYSVAAELARRAGQVDRRCLEYHYLTAFAHRHLLQRAKFEKAVFGGA